MKNNQSGEDEADERRSRPSLRELEVLHAVISFAKTTAAAATLGISQPAVSRAIASLEARTGRALFFRDGGRLVPTADALALDMEAVVILRAVDQLASWPHIPAAEAQLKISTGTTLAQYFLVGLVAEFMRINPEIRIQIEIGNTFSVVNNVADGAADIGIMDQPPAHAGLRIHPLRRAVAHVILPATHILAGQSTLSVSDLIEEPLIALPRRFSTRSLVDQAFREKGAEPKIVVECDTSVFAVELVRRHIGIAILNPFPLAFRNDEALAFRAFRPELPFETAALTSASGKANPLARRFIDFIRLKQPDDPFSTAIRK